MRIVHWLGIAAGALCTAGALAAPIVVNCTNTDADAAAINKAIAASAAGDEIAIFGACSINKTIRLRGDRSYRGGSRSGTVIRQANGANLAALVASDSFLDNTTWTGTPVEIRQLTIDGNRSNNTGSATNCLVIRSWLTIVEAITVMDCNGAGIRLTNLSANGTALKNTQVNGRIAGVFVTRTGGHGIYVEDTANTITDWNLLENWVGHVGGDAIHLDNAAGWVVERNHVYVVGGNAIYAHRLFASSISDNYIEDFGSAPEHGKTYFGIWASVQGGAASAIVGNRIFRLRTDEKADSSYVYLAAKGNYATAMMSSIGNLIRGAGGATSAGMLFTRGSANALVVTAAGNSVMLPGSGSRVQEVGPGVSLNAGEPVAPDVTKDAR